MFELYERFPKNLKDMLTLRQYVYSSTELIFYHYVNLLLLLMASTLFATLHLRYVRSEPTLSGFKRLLKAISFQT